MTFTRPLTALDVDLIVESTGERPRTVRTLDLEVAECGEIQARLWSYSEADAELAGERIRVFGPESLPPPTGTVATRRHAFDVPTKRPPATGNVIRIDAGDFARSIAPEIVCGLNLTARVSEVTGISWGLEPYWFIPEPDANRPAESDRERRERLRAQPFDEWLRETQAVLDAAQRQHR